MKRLLLIVLFSMGCLWAQDESPVRNILKSKGDTFVSNGTTVVRTAACANDQTRIADSTQPTGWKCVPVVQSSQKDQPNGFVGLDASGNAKIGTTVLCANPVTEAGTSLTLTTAHNGCLIKFTNASSVAVTVPAGLPSGFGATLLQLGAGIVSPVASGTTFTTTGTTTGVGSAISLQGTAADTYITSVSGTIPAIGTGLLKGLNGNAIPATASDVAAVFPACGTGPYATTKDLWAGTSPGTLTTGYTATAVPAHGNAVIRVAP